MPQGTPTAVIEGGAEFDADDEPNFNRVDGVVASVEAGAARPEGRREGRPSGGGDRDRNRRRRGRGVARAAVVREVTVVATPAVAAADAGDGKLA